jgi:hypothetical protein
MLAFCGSLDDASENPGASAWSRMRVTARVPSQVRSLYTRRQRAGARIGQGRRHDFTGDAHLVRRTLKVRPTRRANSPRARGSPEHRRSRQAKAAAYATKCIEE